MTARSTTAARADLRERAAAGQLVVVCLCAAWCDSCREFRATYDAIAQADPAGLYVWLDIEDDEALVGDVDIEEFPTLAVYRGENLVHYGVSLPQRGNVVRLIEAAARGEMLSDAPDAIVQLLRSLASDLHADSG
jgi:thioredoxin 1